MKERPILFNGEMVRAILAGRKTQTRRIIKRRDGALPLDFHDGMFWFADGDAHAIDCFYGKVGDRLWVRETWYHNGCLICPCHYRATEPDYTGYEYRDNGWKPSIHMFRWASRLMLEITDVCVQRLNEITEEDAKAEGMRVPDKLYPDNPSSAYSYVENFSLAWDSIYPKTPWVSNPWVWAISFH